MRSSKKTSFLRIRSGRTLRVLFTCVGRRVELLDCFRQAARKLPIRLEIHGADCSHLSPAMHRVSQAHLLPPIARDDYVDALLHLAEQSRIDLLIPLIDPELPLIAAATDRFRAVGCYALISSEPVIHICRDKLLTYRALKKAGIDTPTTWAWHKAIARKRHRFPYYLKPRDGSAAMSTFIVHTLRELRAAGRRVPDAIVQEYVEGAEHTLDVYTGFDSQPRCVVPRKRLEIRAGEVSKGLIVKDRSIMAVGRRVARMLGKCRGVINVQCMVTSEGRIRVIEINPRFGGGVPLTIHAGADFPLWILTEFLGEKPRIDPRGFTNDLAMLRFDEAVYVPDASKLDRAPSRKASRARSLTVASRSD